MVTLIRAGVAQQQQLCPVHSENIDETAGVIGLYYSRLKPGDINTSTLRGMLGELVGGLSNTKLMRTRGIDRQLKMGLSVFAVLLRHALRHG